MLRQRHHPGLTQMELMFLTINFLIWGSLHGMALMVFNAYRYWLRARLGTRGVKRYNANPWIRIGAVILTYEYVAFSLVALFYP